MRTYEAAHNYRAALDAAMALLSRATHQWRRASERGRWAEQSLRHAL